MADGILTDNPHLVLLFYMAQLFLRELVKSYRLIQVVPMDMSGYYGKFNSTPTHDSPAPVGREHVSAVALHLRVIENLQLPANVKLRQGLCQMEFGFGMSCIIGLNYNR